MEQAEKNRWLATICYYYEKAYQKRSWRIGLLLLGILFHLVVGVYYLTQRKNKEQIDRKDLAARFLESGQAQALREKLAAQEQKKNAYLGITKSEAQQKRDLDQLYERELKKAQQQWKGTAYQERGLSEYTYLDATRNVLGTWPGFILSLILAWPMYLYLMIVSNATLYFIANRLVMMFFVIIGVTMIVFTLLYLSPSDPANNILGEQATPEQIENFRNLHGLNDSYLTQLFRTVRGVFTFDLGNTYQGSENVVSAILRRFPVTMELTIFALSLSVLVALPAGIYAAIKRNSTFDHLFMFVALIGISIPSFWQGLIFILTFSINLGWLPATYNANNLASLLMPAVVLGTGLMASVARMTRSSTLEVINEDYILTARSKGLSNQRIILRHAVPNALIPIVTVIGLQFGGMLGGSSVTEKVFNISGVGSYIVDKQFVPDIPAVMGGVIYIAIILSIVNMLVDILYSFLDPRIRSRIRSGQTGK
ncbi:ABC transporter permease [Jeotgalibaca caeni]|uniref:ABC transporter permease n=1 Tax=Jeotgalibaca caeni TaxID=3028623 RepID=UPI00237DE41F|nr:ABC transporter permease [Jeotgalibaca caeni]MDE1549634.1 ABC transporter permease [Jeotgalibaca caeni]